MPAAMQKFRKTAKRLGIQYILNAYGMTETGSMSGMSLKNALNDSDVTIEPVPGVSYRIVDRKTGEILPDKRACKKAISTLKKLNITKKPCC